MGIRWKGAGRQRGRREGLTLCSQQSNTKNPYVSMFTVPATREILPVAIGTTSLQYQKQFALIRSSFRYDARASQATFRPALCVTLAENPTFIFFLLADAE
jgi:hypothetical protein